MSRPEETAPGPGQDVTEGHAPLPVTPPSGGQSATLASRLTSTSTVIALVVLIGGAAILLIGWELGASLFTSLVPGQVTTKPNTAVCFMFSAAALLALQRSSRRERRLGMACAGLAMAIAGVTLAEYVFDWGAGIDELLFHDAMSAAATSSPGRMAPNTAAALILLAGSLLTWNVDLRGLRVTNVLAFLGGLIAFMALLGYVTETTSLAGISGSTRMALPTSILLIALAMAVALARPDRGLPAMVASPGPGGHALRRALPVAVVVPLVLAWIRWRIQATGLVGTQVGIWISASLVIGLSVSLIVAIARSLDRADAERRRAERGLRTLIESAPDAIVVVDGAGAIMRLNAQAEALLGYRREELAGRPVETLLPEGLRETHRAHRRGFAMEPRPRPMGQGLELHALRKDGGGRVPVEISLSPVTLEGRGHVIAAIRDVSDRVQADEALRLAEERFRNAFEEAPIGMALVAPDGRWLRVNRLICEIVGYSEEELLARTFQDITHPDDLDADLEYVRQMLAGEIRTYQMEKRYFHKEGHIVWINLSVSLVRDSGGAPLHFISQIEDITERKRIEHALREAEERFRNMFERSPIGICLVGEDFRFLEVNDALCSITGYAADELERMTFVDITHPDDVANDAHLADRLFTGAIPSYQIEKRYLTKAGETVWVALTATVLRGEDGSVLYGLGLVEDIQDRKRAEAARAEAERARDEFFALVSHELRTPLTSIMVSADLIADGEGEQLTEEGRGYVEVIQRNADREMHLVADLLLLVQIQEGTFRVRLERANLPEIVDDAVEAVRPVAERRGITVSSRTVQTPRCRGDHQRLGQALDNLLANAVKFTPPGGSVEVRLGRRNGAAAIEVEDSGVGIPEAEQRQLFERLYRGSKTKAAEVPGLGLGLTIVKAIVEAHDGTVEVESTEGGGTTFRVELPLEEPEPTHSTHR